MSEVNWRYFRYRFLGFLHVLGERLAKTLRASFF